MQECKGHRGSMDRQVCEGTLRTHYRLRTQDSLIRERQLCTGTPGKEGKTGGKGDKGDRGLPGPAGSALSENLLNSLTTLKGERGDAGPIGPPVRPCYIPMLCFQ